MSALKIGTRGSKLALWQARHVQELLKRRHPDLEVTLEIIKTRGDRMDQVPLDAKLGRSFFVKEIEEALLERRVDLAVHSLKDLPTDLPEGLILGAVPAREAPFDCLVTRGGEVLTELEPGSRVGTGSLRRIAQLRHVRPDLEYLPVRGNVDTRVKKLLDGEFEAVVLAEAGLKRLGIEGVGATRLEPDTMVPAVGQGALGLQIRGDDAHTRERVEALDDPSTRRAVEAERAFLEELGGGCMVPAGALGRARKDSVTLLGLVAEISGKRILRGEESGPVTEAVEVGRNLARRILDMGGRALLETARTAGVLLLGLSLLFGGAAEAGSRRTVVGAVVFGEHRLDLETVDTPKAIETGLMHRRHLPEDSGMLFVFPEQRRLAFWMKNTYIPLSVAFLDRDRRILNIEDMKPLDEITRHRSRGLALYALETNQGWFRRHGVSPGDSATFLTRTIAVPGAPAKDAGASQTPVPPR